MKKVIVKCKLRNRDEFEQKLTDIEMDFLPLYWQHDRVYVPRGYQKQSNYPRMILRTEMRALDRPAKYSLIMRRHIEDSGVDVVHETVIKDYTEAASMILQLGFELQAEISRRRQDLKMGEGTKLFLDKIDGMAGFYAKIESELEDNERVAEVRADLINTLKVLGQDEKTVVTETYAELV